MAQHCPAENVKSLEVPDFTLITCINVYCNLKKIFTIFWVNLGSNKNSKWEECRNNLSNMAA